MSRRSNSAKLVAASLALVTHGALAYGLISSDPVETEGAAGGVEVRLGSSFKDMSKGTIAAERAQVTQATQPDAAKTQQPETAQPAIPTAQHHAAEPSKPMPAAPAVSDGTLPMASPKEVPQDDSDKTLMASLAPSTSLKPVEDNSTAVSRSLRPKRRSSEFEATHTPKPVKTRKANKVKKPASRKNSASGNAQRTARAGDTSGTRAATTSQSGQGGKANSAGNAAVSNYPGLVMRKLSRAGKPRVNARGAAVVAFTIGGSGRLASVSLARGSGTSALDRAALRLVERAGPFPSPPQGARRSFTIQIKGR